VLLVIFVCLGLRRLRNVLLVTIADPVPSHLPFVRPERIARLALKVQPHALLEITVLSEAQHLSHVLLGTIVPPARSFQLSALRVLFAPAAPLLFALPAHTVPSVWRQRLLAAVVSIALLVRLQPCHVHLAHFAQLPALLYRPARLDRGALSVLFLPLHAPLVNIALEMHFQFPAQLALSAPLLPAQPRVLLVRIVRWDQCLQYCVLQDLYVRQLESQLALPVHVRSDSIVL
jgi:hypothetical protein